MNDKTLIEVVRNYSALYNFVDGTSTDTDNKNIWKQIGEQLKTPEQTCKSKWGKSSKYVTENTTVSGRQVNSTKLNKYSEQRNSSNKSFNERDTRTNNDDEVKVQDRSGDEEYDSRESSETQLLLSMKPEKRTVIIPTETGSLRYPRPTRELSLLSQQPRPKTAAATFMEYLVKDKDCMSCSSTLSPHVVDTFLTGIAPALKKLTPGYWHYAKAEIFATVQKYELKMFTEKQPLQNFN